MNSARLRPGRAAVWPLLVASLLVAAACDDDGGSTPSDADMVDDTVDDTTPPSDTTTPPDAELACTPDPVALADGRRCVDDDQCPCGAHCSLGLCVADCSASVGCVDGQVCDQFGRCRTAPAGATLSRVALQPPTRQGRARIDQTALRYLDAETPRRMTLTADGGPVETLRVVSPSPRAEIALARPGVPDAELEFAGELTHTEPLAEGEQLVVFVRPVAGMAPAPGEEFGTIPIDVFDSGGKHDGTVLTDEAPDYDDLPDPQTAPPLEGVYEGVARLALSGVGTANDLQASPPERDVSTPLEVEVYPAAGDRAVIVIHDPLRLLHPSGTWTGEIVLDADPHLDLPAFEQIPEVPVIGGTVQVIASTREAVLASDPRDTSWNGRLQAQLDVRFDGTSSTRQSPHQRWSLGLRRVGDLTAGATAPTPDADATPSYDANAVAQTPFALEQAFLDAIAAPEPLNPRIELAFYDDRSVWPLVDELVCADPLSIRSDRLDEALSEFAVEPLEGIYDLGGAYRLGLSYNVRDAVSPPDDGATVTWAEFKSRAGTAEALNAPALQQIVDAMTLTTGNTADVELTAIGVGYGGFELDDYAFALPDGQIIERAIPCAYDLTGAAPLGPQQLTDFNSNPRPYAIDLDTSGIAVDVCDRMAALHECEVVDLVARGVSDTERESTFTMFFRGVMAGGPPGDDELFHEWQIPGLLYDKACVLPSRPSSCVETAICTDGRASEGVTISSLATTIDPITGDLDCRQSTAGVWLPADLQMTDAETLRTSCATAIDALDVAAPAVTGSTSQARLDSIGWNDASDCLNPARFVTALGVTGTPARDLGWLVPERDQDVPDALFIRHLQRLLEIAAFVAGGPVDGAALLPGFAVTSPLVDMETALADSLDSWLVIFHPRVGASLAGLSGSALFDPDYRSRLLASPPVPAHVSVDEGLLVTMMDALTSQLELTALIADHYARQGTREIPDSVADALGRMRVADAWLSGLAARAESVDATRTPRWLADYQLARARYEALRAELLFELAASVRGLNPLGIEDADLPLYFRQIASDAGSRFTAITDYILGDGPTGNAVAQVLVSDALAAFDDARAAYLAEQQRQVNAINEQVAVDLRVVNAKQRFGQTLEDLCGREAFAPLQDTEIPDALDDDFDTRTCWFRGDDPACTVEAAPVPTDAELLAEAEAEAALSVSRSLCEASNSFAAYQYRACFDTTRPDGSTSTLCTYGGGDVFLLSQVPALQQIQRRAQREWQGLESVTRETDDPYSDRTLTTDVQQAYRYDANRIIEFGLCDRPDLPDQFFINGEMVSKAQLLLPEVEVDLTTNRTVLRCSPAQGLTGDPIVIEIEEYELIPTEGAGFYWAAETFSPTAASQFCERAFPAGSSPRNQPSFDVVPATCYRGSLGAEAIALKSLVADIEIARSEQLDAIDAYEIAMESCFILQSGNSQLQEAQAAYADERQALVELRSAMEIGSVIANNTADCLDSVGGAEKSWQYAVAGGACAARAVEAGFHTVQIVTEANIENLDTRHDATILAIESATAEQQCFKEAELELVAADTAALNTLRAMQELQVGYAAFFDSLEQADLAVSRGYADIADAEASGVRQLGRDPWFNRDIERYADKLELARRGAYLAVRAVEYEFQTSLSQRGSVLQAETADELEQVLTELRQITATGSINGAQPAELTEVVSLRQHLLQLADQSDAPASEQVLSDVERFRLALQDPANEVYEDGVFVGRAIPFQLAPLSVFDRGQVTGVPIVSDNACGERLWAVNVSIQGDPAATFRGIAPQVNLQVRKRNTAYSNWCQPEQHTDAFQMVSVRPRRNLFRVPGAGEGITLDGGDPTEDFAVARVQALLDVPASEFLTDAYTDGASSELAARPLFGDYELFIPATSLVEVDASGQPASDGLVLNQVDDILLRVDYLSVAN